MLKNFLYIIDLFGLSPKINFAGKEKSKSVFGGFCSILFFAFALWSVINGSKDLFSKVNPKTISSQSNKEEPSNAKIGPEGFPIAIQIQASDTFGYKTYMDESIFTLNVYLSQSVRVIKDGVAIKEWNDTKLHLESCTPEYFTQDMYNVYSKLLELPMYCIARDQSFDIRLVGTWSSVFYQRIYIELAPCNNNTSPVTCASKEMIETYLSGGWINIIFNDMVVDPNNYTRPDGVFQQNYYKILSLSNYYETQIDLGRVEVSTDSGWLLEDIGVKNYTNVIKVTENMLGRANPKGTLIGITLQMGKLENFYFRRYKKIQDVLAEVAGLTNTAMLILLVLTTPYLNFKFKESLINEIFEVKMSPSKISQKKHQPQAQKSLRITKSKSGLISQKNEVELISSNEKDHSNHEAVFLTNEEKKQQSENLDEKSGVSPKNQPYIEIKGLKPKKSHGSKQNLSSSNDIEIAILNSNTISVAKENAVEPIKKILERHHGDEPEYSSQVFDDFIPESKRERAPKGNSDTQRKNQQEAPIHMEEKAISELNSLKKEPDVKVNNPDGKSEKY